MKDLRVQPNQQSDSTGIIIYPDSSASISSFSKLNGYGRWDIFNNLSAKTFTFHANPSIKTKSGAIKLIQRCITVPYDGELIKYKNHPKQDQLFYKNGRLELGEDGLLFDKFESVCRVVAGSNGEKMLIPHRIHCSFCRTKFSDLLEIAKCADSTCSKCICGVCAREGHASEKFYQQMKKYCPHHYHALALNYPSFNFIFDYNASSGVVDVHTARLSPTETAKLTFMAHKFDFFTSEKIIYQFVMYML